MAGKIFARSRYANVDQVAENDGKVIFVVPRRPLVKKEFADNITYRVRARDTIDLISFTFYDDEIYGWVIADFNNFLFPDADLQERETIIIPSKTTLFNEILPNL